MAHCHPRHVGKLSFCTRALGGGVVGIVPDAGEGIGECAKVEIASVATGFPSGIYSLILVSDTRMTLSMM